MMYLLMKFRKSQTKFSRNSRKISLQFQRISKMESGICMIVERREIIQEKRQKFYQIVLLLMVGYFFWRYYSQLLKAAKRQASSLTLLQLVRGVRSRTERKSTEY